MKIYEKYDMKNCDIKEIELKFKGKVPNNYFSKHIADVERQFSGFV
jgi:hypothetical protein